MNRPLLIAAALALLAIACHAAAEPSAESAASASAPVSPPPAASAGSHPDTSAIELKPGNPWLEYVKVESVRPTEAGSVITLTGRVTFDEDHTQRVASPVDGRVREIKVRPGDRVKEGQTLLTLTSPQVAQLESDAQKAAQDLSVAEKASARASKLKGDGAISEKEVAQVEADFQKAKSELARATAQLKALGIAGTPGALQAELHAQVAGTVVDRTVLVGQEVRADAAQPLLTVSNLDTVWVMADVYEQDLGIAQVGAQVKVSVPAYPGDVFTGAVSYVGDLVDPTTRTVKVRCQIPNPDGRLKPEMFAKVELQAPRGSQVLLVPTRAVLTDGEKSEVLVAEKGGVFRVRRVEVGAELDGRVRVLKGLEPQEVVVTDGALFLKKEIQDQ